MLCVLINKLLSPGIKRFQPSKFFGCGRRIISVSIKENTDSGIKRFQILKKVLPAAGYSFMNRKANFK